MSTEQPPQQRPRRDLRTRYARRRWPTPFDKTEGAVLAWAMNRTAEPLIPELKRTGWWRRWLGRR